MATNYIIDLTNVSCSRKACKNQLTIKRPLYVIRGKLVCPTCVNTSERRKGYREDAA